MSAGAEAMTVQDYDAVVIGGGIAGTAVAAQLAGDLRVAVLEMENQPGYHSTGRSAALFAEAYGNSIIRALTRASRSFLFSPDPAFSDEELVRPRKVMIFGHAEQRQAFETFVGNELPSENLELISPDAAVALCPALRSEGLLGAVVDSGSADIEVHALQHGYIRMLKRQGGDLIMRAKVDAIQVGPDAKNWTVFTTAGTYRARILINAAGAWADEIALMAGIAPIGIEPRQRTAALVDIADDLDAGRWPMVLDVEESFYMKPDAGLLLISPADETLVEPGDVQADELAVAIAAHRVETFTSVEVRRIRSKWAGLRSFVRDRSPVVGYDADSPNFFWLAALGGYGIQTAPALSSLAAKLVLRSTTDVEFATLGFRPIEISPERLARQRPAAEVGNKKNEEQVEQ